MEHFSLNILGASSAIPLANRSPTAQFLSMADHYFLIDCGEGTQVKLRQHNIGLSRIEHILISHLHGDHFYGLVPLLSSLSLLERQKPIHIYGPAALEEGINQIMALSNSRLNFPLHFHPTDPNKKALIFESERIEVFSFPLSHSIECTGFYFKEKLGPRKIIKSAIEGLNLSVPELRALKQGKDLKGANGEVLLNENFTLPPLEPFSYAFCSDTQLIKHLHRYFQNTDLLYHEATFTEEYRHLATRTKHSTTKDAAHSANITATKNLLIGHFSVRYKNFKHLLKEAQEDFEATYIAKEGCVYTMKRKSRNLEFSRLVTVPQEE
jgi:ribonuclease Z